MRHHLEGSRTCLKDTETVVRLAGLVVLLLLLNQTAQARTHQPAAASAPPQVEIAGTQWLHLFSANTNKEYDLYINLPRGYGDSTKTFPVLFLLDAQWDFPLVQAIYGEQYYDGFIPEMVIVGITWGGKNPDYDKLRAHDLTPADVSRDGSFGNAPKFLSFLVKELIPYIEGKFRVKPNDRTLMGSSLGGLFTLYAMFQEPGIFNRYVLTSPALQFDNRMIYSLHKSYAEQHKDLDAKLFMGIGEYEMVMEFQNFVDELKAKKYQKFQLETKIISGMGHSGGKAEGYTRGLQSVFARPSVHIDPSILATYTGEYVINSQYKITLVKEHDKLFVLLPDGSRSPVHAESDVDFYVTGSFLNFHIEKDQNGQVSGLLSIQYNGTQFCQKVKK